MRSERLREASVRAAASDALPTTTQDSSEEPPSRSVRRDLRSMVGDGVAFSVMVGFGESYLPAFALALGYGAVTAGFVATLPMLAGSVLQLVTPAAVGLLGSHRRWVVLCATLQALSFVPLIAGGLAGRLDLWALYVAAAVYWGLGMSTGPAWTAWATTLVPSRIRARFFARRAALGQVALVAALLSAGVILEVGVAHGEPVAPYALLFGLACLARLVSSFCLFSQSEPTPVPIGETRISPAIIARHVRTGGHGRLLAFLLAFQLGVWVAAPYFTPYMLGPLGLGYFEFTVLTTSAFAARIVAYPLVGALSARWGTRRVLLLATSGIVPLPLLWLVSDSFWWLFALQLLGGTVWAAFELGTLLSFFERIPLHGQASVLTVYNLANATAIVLGSVVGAGVLDTFASPTTGFIVLMCVSSLARLAATPLLRSLPDAPRPERLPPLRVLSARPSTGGVQRPILESDRSEVA